MKQITLINALILTVGIMSHSTAHAQDPMAQDGTQPAVNEYGDPVQPQAAAPAPQPANTEAQYVSATPLSAGSNLAEAPGVGYHSVGARFRWIFVPKWFITMFNADIAAQNEKHPLVSNLAIGAEYTYRKDNFDITAAIWGAQLDWEDPIYFKSGGEPEGSWTQVTNGLSALLFTADFIWSSPIRDWVAITYGVGLGFGFPIGGDIIETEAYRMSDGSLAPCNGPGQPTTDDNYCEEGGEYHEVYDKLKVVPWINLLVGARFKPHEHLAIYVDGGFGIGFQMGVRAGYIF